MPLPKNFLPENKMKVASYCGAMASEWPLLSDIKVKDELMNHFEF
jgi:hypothetical protein